MRWSPSAATSLLVSLHYLFQRSTWLVNSQCYLQDLYVSETVKGQRRRPGVDCSRRRRGQGSGGGARVLEHARDQRRCPQALRRGRRAHGFHSVPDRAAGVTHGVLHLPQRKTSPMVCSPETLGSGVTVGRRLDGGSGWARCTSLKTIARHRERPTRRPAPMPRSTIAARTQRLLAPGGRQSDKITRSASHGAGENRRRHRRGFRSPDGLGLVFHQGRIRRRAHAKRRFCRVDILPSPRPPWSPALRAVRANARRLTGGVKASL